MYTPIAMHQQCHCSHYEWFNSCFYHSPLPAWYINGCVPERWAPFSPGPWPWLLKIGWLHRFFFLEGGAWSALICSCLYICRITGSDAMGQPICLMDLVLVELSCYPVNNKAHHEGMCQTYKLKYNPIKVYALRNHTSIDIDEFNMLIQVWKN